MKIIPTLLTFASLFLFVGCVSSSDISNTLSPNTIVLQNPRNSELHYYHIPSATFGRLQNTKNIVKTNSYIHWYKQIDEEYHFYNYVNDYGKNEFTQHSFYDLPEKNLDFTIEGEAAHVSNDMNWLFLDSKENFKIKNLNSNYTAEIPRDMETVQLIDIINNQYLYYFTNLVAGSSPKKDIARVDIQTNDTKTVDIGDYFAEPIISPDGEKFIIAQYKNILRPSLNIGDNNYTLLLYDFNSKLWMTIEEWAIEDNGTPIWINNDEFIYQKITQLHNRGINWADIEDMTCSDKIYHYNINQNQKKLLYQGKGQCVLLVDFNNDTNSAFIISRNIEASSFALEKIDIYSGEKMELYRTEFPIDYLSQIHLDPNKLNISKSKDL